MGMRRERIRRIATPVAMMIWTWIGTYKLSGFGVPGVLEGLLGCLILVLWLWGTPIRFLLGRFSAQNRKEGAWGAVRSRPFLFSMWLAMFAWMVAASELGRRDVITLHGLLTLGLFASAVMVGLFWADYLREGRQGS
jgi:hypothetical protein